MDKFAIGLIVLIGSLVSGIFFLIYSDNDSTDSLDVRSIKNVLKDAEYMIENDGFRNGGDTHYDRVDRDGKYYASMTHIMQNNDGTIQVTFNSNYFVTDGKLNMESKIQDNLTYVTPIEKNQTFVVNCGLIHLSDRFSNLSFYESDSSKVLGVLKYQGITEKEGVQYYMFHHESIVIPKDTDCKFPDLIEYSLDIDMDIDISNRSFPDEVWDHDWN